MTMLILLLCQRSKQLRGNTFFANFHQYLRETVFVYSYGAQVESFNQKKGRKSRDTFPLICLTYISTRDIELLYCTYNMRDSWSVLCLTAVHVYAGQLVSSTLINRCIFACETFVLLDSRQPYFFICKQRFFGTHDTFFAFVRNNFLITITKNSLLVSSPKMCLLSLYICSMSYETCEF